MFSSICSNCAEGSLTRHGRFVSVKRELVSGKFGPSLNIPKKPLPRLLKIFKAMGAVVFISPSIVIFTEEAFEAIFGDCLHKDLVPEGRVEELIVNQQERFVEVAGL